MTKIKFLRWGRNEMNGGFSRVIMCVFFGLTPTIAIADQAYLIVGFECSASKSELTVWFRGYENEKGAEAIANLRENSFDPRKLVTFTKAADGKYKIKEKTLYKACQIGLKKYKIEIYPALASRFHPEGLCASRVGAKVIVKLEGKTLIDEGYDACREAGYVTTEFILSPNHKIVQKKLEAEKFFIN